MPKPKAITLRSSGSVLPAIRSILLVSCLLLSACQNSKQNKEQTDVAKHLPPAQEKKYHFSSLENVDTFKLDVVGSDPDKVSFVFTITNAAGKELYRTTILSQDLFKNYDSELDLKKKSDQLRFLDEEAKNFFSEENFLEPAVTESEQPDANVPDKAFYNELQKSQLNGFKYRLGKDTSLYIAWSAQKQKVLIYYKCC